MDYDEPAGEQVQIAVEQSDEIIFVVDAMNGVTDLDDHVAEILRKSLQFYTLQLPQFPPGGRVG